MTPAHKKLWRTTVAVAAAAVVLPLILTACSNDKATGLDTTEGSGGLFASKVDVDTPALRAAKAQIGVEPCRSGPGEGAVDGGLPEVTLPCLGGGPSIDLSRFRGPLVINLWAQSCGPCREELPYYQRMHAEAADVVDVVGVDYQDTRPDAALELAGDTGVTYPLLADPGAVLRIPFKVRALPAVVLVDSDGVVTHLEYVAIRSYDQLRDLVEEHLDVTLTGAR